MSLERGLAARIRLVVFDVDGVLTDGGLYFVDNPEGAPYGLRRFHVQDGIGTYMLRDAGIEMALVSGKDSAAVRARASELGIEEVHQVPPWDKVVTVAGILERTGIGWEETACLADDLADMALLERVALPAAVPNAVAEVRRAARWEGTVPGGRGAVREFAESLLRARGEWSRRVEAYVERCREGTGAAADGDGTGGGTSAAGGS